MRRLASFPGNGRFSRLFSIHGKVASSASREGGGESEF